MAKIRLAPGVWTNSAATVLGGAGAVTGATAEQTWLQIIGWAGMVLGLGALLWGVTVDGEHWWKRKRASEPSPQLPKRVPLDEAIRYLGGYPVSKVKMLTDPNFTISVGIALKDALVCGDIEARGREFKTLHGGIRNPPMHPMQPIPAQDWRSVDINAYWALTGTIPQIAAGRHPNAVKTGDHEGLHDIELDREQLQALWPEPGMIE
jgi:hypothetical protein